MHSLSILLSLNINHQLSNAFDNFWFFFMGDYFKRGREDDFRRVYDDKRGYEDRRSYDRGYDRGYDDKRRKYDNDIKDPFKLDYLVSFSQFAEMTSRKGKPVEQDELEKRYDALKETITKKQFEQFFRAHSSEEWFREKYHPVERESLLLEVKKRRLEFLSDFESALRMGSLDSLSFDDIGNLESNGEHTVSDEPPPSIDSSIHALFIKSVPIDIKRSEILQLFKDVAEFKYLVLTDPRIDKKMTRLGWLVFDKGTDMPSMLARFDMSVIKDVELHLAIHHFVAPKPRFVSYDFNLKERLMHDLDQAKTLAIFLDNDCNFKETNVSLIKKYFDSKLSSNINDELEKIKKELDLHIEYLAAVHNYEYYSGLECNSQEDFARRRALFLRRTVAPSVPRDRKDTLAEKIDSRILFRIEQPTSGPMVTKRGGKSMDVQIDKTLSLYIRKESESKYRCIECQKLFKGDEFVRKHLKIKHESILQEEQESVLFFNNFSCDLNKLDLRTDNRPNSSSREAPRERRAPRRDEYPVLT